MRMAISGRRYCRGAWSCALIVSLIQVMQIQVKARIPKMPVSLQRFKRILCGYWKISIHLAV